MKKNIFTKIAKRFLLLNGYFQLHKDAYLSFSQMGEDRILEKIFFGKAKGFYVDVGAFHPILYSNTFVFYLKGWKGINIDALPGSMDAFNKIRPRDINLEIGISSKEGWMKYFKMNNNALNTVSQSRLEQIKKNGEFSLEKTFEIKTKPLKKILDRYLPKKMKIDFFSIDVEGYDLEVLRSNDWKKYRPKIIVVESANFLIEKPEKDHIYMYLKNKKYQLVAKTDCSLIFQSTI